MSEETVTTDTGTPQRRTVIIPAPDAPPPAREDYRIVRKVASGGMGVVYLARDERLGRFIALKRLSRRFWASEVMKSRFFREAKSIAALNHSHIVHVYALAEDAQGPYIAMEYVAGTPAAEAGLPGAPLTLEDKINRDGPMPVEEATNLLIKLCSALQYAHGEGVIHRDLKPTNVLLTESGEPKVADFGLALRMHVPEDSLTKTGTKMISLGYSAPEQETDASSVDARADIYSLGGVLYCCLTGENPRFFREARVPEHLRPAVLRALESDRERRWQTVAEFERALYHSGVHPPSAPGRSTWRCKWCHETNPFARRFCAECGWDGLEPCPECGGESRIGVQFCGACGTDSRAFEEAQRTLARMRQHLAARKYLLVQELGEGMSFQPRGEGGRRVATELRDTAEAARLAVARREALQRSVPAEYERGNYDAVRDQLHELASLSDDTTFAAIAQELPRRMAQRDLHEAWLAFHSRDLRTAEDLARGICEAQAGETAGAQDLLRRLRRRLLRRSALRVAAILALLLAGYLAALRPAASAARGGDPYVVAAVETLYAPVLALRDKTSLRRAIDRLADLRETDPFIESDR